MIVTQTKRHLSLRISDNELEQIDKSARERRLSRTDYIIAACTGRLDAPSEADERFDGLHQRVTRLEALLGD